MVITGEKFGEHLANSKFEEAKHRIDFYLATAALSFYMARSDGHISKNEIEEIGSNLNNIINGFDMTDETMIEVLKIVSNENISFAEVTPYLDKISINLLKLLGMDLEAVIEASDGELSEEQRARNEYFNYLKARMKAPK